MPNVTIVLDRELVKRARKIAIDRDTTLNGLIRDYLADLVRQEELRREVIASELERIVSLSPAVVGARTWSRDQLHER